MITVFDRLNLTIVDVRGRDAAAVLNNLTTNDVKKLDVDHGIETFMTNVKGKCVGHAMVYRHADGFVWLGAGGQTNAIMAQIDRYTIREEVQVSDVGAMRAAMLVVRGPRRRARELDQPFFHQRLTVAGRPVEVYPVPWVGQESEPIAELWLLAESADADTIRAAIAPAVSESLTEADVRWAGEADFHAARVAAGFPWFGVDFSDEHLPQEVNRNSQTLSFTKGCYLGQETVARLDALGQVQKQLVCWRLTGLVGDAMPPADTLLLAMPEPDTDHGKVEGDATPPPKPVGRLTSVVGAESLLTQPVTLTQPGPTDRSVAMAIGFARRSHFDAGAVARGQWPDTQDWFLATVVVAGIDRHHRASGPVGLAEGPSAAPPKTVHGKPDFRVGSQLDGSREN